MSNEELALQIKAGNTELYAELWKNTEKLMIWKINKLYDIQSPRFARAGLELDDLKQLAFFALIAAVEAYDPQKSYAFSSYISFHLRNTIAAALGIRSSRRDPLNNCTSLDMLVGEDEDITIGELFADPDSDCPFDEIADNDLIAACRRDLEKIMSEFPEDEAAVIRCKYFEGSDNRMRVSEELNMPYHKVCRLESNALTKFRQPKNKRALQLYREELIGSKPYTGSGLSRFKAAGMSSVEWCTELLERARNTRNRRKLLRKHMFDK